MLRSTVAATVALAMMLTPVSALASDDHEREYEEGKPIPEGYKVEERRNTGVLTAGGVFTALGLLGIIVGASTDTQDGDVGAPSTSAALSLLGAMSLIGGGIMVIAGLPTHRVLVRETASAPVPTYGMSVGFRF